MKQTKVLQEIRLMKSTEVHGWSTESKLTQAETPLPLHQSKSTRS